MFSRLAAFALLAVLALPGFAEAQCKNGACGRSPARNLTAVPFKIVRTETRLAVTIAGKAAKIGTAPTRALVRVIRPAGCTVIRIRQ